MNNDHIREKQFLARMGHANNVQLVMDRSDEQDAESEKLVYSWYASKEEAIAQAEHEMATPAAAKRLNAHFGKDDMVLHPSGLKVLHIKDAKGKVIWTPKGK